MKGKKGILLINLGTPNSPSTADVRTYLDEFLSDPRVIDLNPIGRFFLVKGIILPMRSPKSAATYQKIWTENGSPLLYYTIRQKELLEQRLGNEYMVEYAMRYQNPSIESVLEKFRKAKVFDIKIIPLFPQYASATTGSVHDMVMAVVKNWQIVPNIEFVNSFPDHPVMIDAFASVQYESVIFEVLPAVAAGAVKSTVAGAQIAAGFVTTRVDVFGVTAALAELLAVLVSIEAGNEAVFV